MAKENRLWGAERIRGELLKLGLRICKRTIQKYMRKVRTPQPRGQKWSTFLHTHAGQIWACDALSGHRSVLSTALCFLPHPPEVATGDPSRRHSIAFRSLGGPTPPGSDSLWASTEYLIHDNDSTFGPCFARVATTSGIEILTTPYHAPRVVFSIIITLVSFTSSPSNRSMRCDGLLVESLPFVSFLWVHLY
jgi:putative transposase